MATVPGLPTDDGGIPKSLHPSQAELLIAGQLMKEQGRFQVAGDVVPFPKPAPFTGSDEDRKMMTRDTLSRALGGTKNILPMKDK